MKRSEKRIIFILCFFVLAALPAICLADKMVAERPVYSEGDAWTFISKTKVSEITHTFLREENDKYVFSLDGSDRTEVFYFTSGIKKLVGYIGPIIDFPLAVGKKWDCKFQIKKPTGNPKRDQKVARYKVESFESITVPAGTFQSFKITVVIEGAQHSGTRDTEEYWYAPDVKQLIKRKTWKGNIMELKEYSIK